MSWVEGIGPLTQVDDSTVAVARSIYLLLLTLHPPLATGVDVAAGVAFTGGIEVAAGVVFTVGIELSAGVDVAAGVAEAGAGVELAAGVRSVAGAGVAPDVR
jgi:hypothetical protein